MQTNYADYDVACAWLICVLLFTEIGVERLQKMFESCCVDSVEYPDQILDFQKP